MEITRDHLESALVVGLPAMTALVGQWRIYRSMLQSEIRDAVNNRVAEVVLDGVSEIKEMQRGAEQRIQTLDSLVISYEARVSATLADAGENIDRLMSKMRADAETISAIREATQDIVPAVVQQWNFRLQQQQARLANLKALYDDVTKQLNLEKAQLVGIVDADEYNVRHRTIIYPLEKEAKELETQIHSYEINVRNTTRRIRIEIEPPRYPLPPIVNEPDDV